jgi:Ca-activated chloride channel family protein
LSSQVVIHRAAPRGSRLARVLLTLAVVAAAGGGAVYLIWHVTVGSRACGPTDGVTLHVVASPDITPSITDVARQWVATRPVADGQCVRVAVAAGTTKAPTDGRTPTGAAMWIPDSSVWIARQKTVDRGTFSGTTVSIATSPVVFAISAANATAQTAAKGLLSSTGRLDLAKLGGAVEASCASGQSAGFRIALDDPTADAASLAATTWLGGQVADPNCQMAFYRQIGHLDTRDDLIAAVAKSVDTVPLPEQAVLAYDATHASRPLRAILPQQSTTVLDYPAAIYAGLPVATSTAAFMFRDQLVSATSTAIFAKAGFRAVQGSAGAGFPTAAAVDSSPVEPTAMDSAAALSPIGGVWKAAKNSGRVLALVDTGPSMARTDGGSNSRIKAISDLAGGGLGLFDPDDELGIWAYGGAASANPLGYSPVVQPKPLDPKQLTAVADVLDGVTPSGRDDCGFFPAVLAAYRYMSSNFDPGRANTLIVFTDSTATCPGITPASVELQLSQLATIDKPIALIILGIGPDIDLRILNDLSATVNGKVFPVTAQTDIQTVFMEALREIATSYQATINAGN